MCAAHFCSEVVDNVCTHSYDVILTLTVMMSQPHVCSQNFKFCAITGILRLVESIARIHLYACTCKHISPNVFCGSGLNSFVLCFFIINVGEDLGVTGNCSVYYMLFGVMLTK